MFSVSFYWCASTPTTIHIHYSYPELIQVLNSGTFSKDSTFTVIDGMDRAPKEAVAKTSLSTPTLLTRYWSVELTTIPSAAGCARPGGAMPLSFTFADSKVLV
ncbi:hypothetical protein BDV93DRAFT_594305 [Ceratobasidium sp. AG-I]|nr:hypothetical protein BDV93DRAFT_594305 [Ceratobasidium sp. AG-I]